MYNQQFNQNEFNAINAVLDDITDTGSHDISGLIVQLTQVETDLQTAQAQITTNTNDIQTAN